MSSASAADLALALKESEARFRQVMDNSSAVVFGKDPEGRYLFVNREFERVTGRGAGEVIGRSDREIFPPELAARLRQNDLRVLLERRAVEFEETFPFGQSERTFLSSKFPLLNSDGAPYAVCGIATDITDRKRVEDALSSAALAVSTAEGEQLFSELARYVSMILDVDGALIATRTDNDPSRLRVVALHLDGQLHPSFDYELAGTPCELVLQQGFQFRASGMTRDFASDASLRHVGIEGYAGYALTDSGGKALGVIAVLSRRPLERPSFLQSVLKIFAVRASAEIERVAAQEAARASQESYREIFEASPDAIFVHDWDTGAIVDVNPKACEAYGYTREEMRTLDINEISSGAPPYTGEEAARLIGQAKSEGALSFEWHRKSRDGSLHWDEVLLKSAQIGGKPRVLAFTREITERKEAEARRTRLEAQLRQAQKMEALGKVTGGIAHDFNNLLASIMGYIVLAIERQEGSGDARLAKYLEQAHESCERARQLIQQMLMFSRGQRGEPRPLALPESVERTLALLAPSIPPDVTTTLDLDRDTPPVLLDPVQLEQILVNLCINARDALQSGGGTIGIAVRESRLDNEVCTACRQNVSGTFVELCVADDGAGIPENVLEHIFEPFFTTKASGKGTGMGLATVHGIVHEHRGHILVETAAGEGARFRVCFPALRAAHAPAAAPDTAQDHRVRKPSLRGSVLIVDDEETVGEFMRELLETWGLEATFVAAPDTALDLVTREPARFDVVITDQAMPRMTGLELIRALRGVRPELPVVLYSAYGENIAAADLEAAEIREVLGKPVEPASLLAALGAQLSR